MKEVCEVPSPVSYTNLIYSNLLVHFLLSGADSVVIYLVSYHVFAALSSEEDWTLLRQDVFLFPSDLHST